jgi:hypothetical protein
MDAIARLIAQLVERRLGLFQVRPVEAFGETVVDFDRARLLAWDVLMPIFVGRFPNPVDL